MRVGRPSLYSLELATDICSRIADGRTLRDVCDDKGMPTDRTVYLWIGRYPEFAKMFAEAREMRAHRMFDELNAIADDGRNDWMERLGEDGKPAGYIVNGEHIARSRLRVDTRKWMLCKLLPKVYGDKLELEHSGNVGFFVEGPAVAASPEAWVNQYNANVFGDHAPALNPPS